MFFSWTAYTQKPGCDLPFFFFCFPCFAGPSQNVILLAGICCSTSTVNRIPKKKMDIKVPRTLCLCHIVFSFFFLLFVLYLCFTSSLPFQEYSQAFLFAVVPVMVHQTFTIGNFFPHCWLLNFNSIFVLFAWVAAWFNFIFTIPGIIQHEFMKY